MRLYNTLSRKKELFRPIRKDRVGLYTCGPTVYNYLHIGNLRTYVFEDVLRRTLEYAGYNVRHVMNITDVDDKIIRDAEAAGVSIFDFVKPYEKAFLEDLQKLNIEPAWRYAKATEHIPEMIRLIQKLLKRKMAYVGSDGSVYFDISSFKPYGRLSRLKHNQIKSGTRALNHQDEYTKDNVQDFSLWKAKKEGEPAWSTPFGEGHPGWHIECSAMSMKYLGNTFDIHGGAVDLIFPHHENEIAQSEGATGKPFAKFFVEGEHLLVNGAKMSKSLRNFFTLRDIETRRVDPLAFRYLVLTAHYRTKLNFTWESLEAAQGTLNRIRSDIGLLANSRIHAGHLLAREVPPLKKSIERYREDFKEAIFNDLNTPQALGALNKLLRLGAKIKDSPELGREIMETVKDFDRILGLGLAQLKKERVPAHILRLAARREDLRKEKKWAEADTLRKEVAALGYSIEDTVSGFKMRKK
ncbi:MAG: cysteine--tRNA ligase [Candidatus Sungbacteria bacterium]|nr:cysteine--tRNA ligase [Candidatus Sungbacteria bacterium]